MQPDTPHSDMWTTIPIYRIVVNQIRLALALTIALLFLATCTQATSTPTVEEVLTKAHEAMGQLQSYRTAGEITGISDEGPFRSDYYTEWAAPDRFHLMTEGIDEEGVFHFNEFLHIGERTFSRDSQEGFWREGRSAPPPDEGADNNPVPAPDAASFAMPQDEVIGSIEVFHVVWETTQDMGSMPEPGQGSVVTFSTTQHLFIDKRNFRVVRTITETEMPFFENVLVDGTPVIQRTEQSSILTSDYYDYNEPVALEVPDVE